jgi:hypothetical protein
MGRKRQTAEQIIAKLREAEVVDGPNHVRGSLARKVVLGASKDGIGEEHRRDGRGDRQCDLERA